MLTSIEILTCSSFGFVKLRLRSTQTDLQMLRQIVTQRLTCSSFDFVRLKLRLTLIGSSFGFVR